MTRQLFEIQVKTSSFITSEISDGRSRVHVAIVYCCESNPGFCPLYYTQALSPVKLRMKFTLFTQFCEIVQNNGVSELR